MNSIIIFNYVILTQLPEVYRSILIEIQKVSLAMSTVKIFSHTIPLSLSHFLSPTQTSPWRSFKGFFYLLTVKLFISHFV